VLIALTVDLEESVFRKNLRKVIPKWLIKERGIFLRLGPAAGLVYARLRLRDLIGIRTSDNMTPDGTAQSFLFVCYGNIMRSPIAEAMLRRELADKAWAGKITIASAGLHATPGKAAHPWALTASQEIGMPLSNHRAQLVTADLVSRFDVIFAMDFQNKAELLGRFPEAAAKVVMLSAYGEASIRNREIPDPYLGDVETTRQCYAVLQTCIRNFVSELSAVNKADGHDVQGMDSVTGLGRVARK
jgi:protein-tyrosine-phosphatase